MDYMDLKKGDKIRYLGDNGHDPHPKYKIGDILTLTDNYMGCPEVINCEGVKDDFLTSERNWELVEINRESQRTNFDNCKVHVRNPQESEAVQKRLFELGYEWGDGTREVACKDIPYLFIYKNVFKMGCDLQSFEKTDNLEVTPEDILGTKTSNKDLLELEDIDLGWTTAIFTGTDLGKCTIKLGEENKMELEKINKNNIKNAIAKVKEDKATEEQQYAEQQYINYVNQRDRIERDRKDLIEEEKEMNKRYAVFITKAKK